MKRLRYVLFSLIALALSFLFCEILSLVVLWVGWRQTPSTYLDFIRGYHSKALHVSFTYDYRAHPYLGFKNPHSMKDLETIQANNKPPEEFWIGVFGGSVAEGFVVDPGVRSLFESQLKDLPSVAGRKIRVLQLANGGYKQPQQTILYTLYGEKLDLVINLEGVNETSDFMLGHHFPLDFPMTAFRYQYHESLGQFEIFISKMLVTLVHHAYYGFVGNNRLHSSPLATLAALATIQVGAVLHPIVEVRFQDLYRRKFLPNTKFGSNETLEKLLDIWERGMRTQALLSVQRQVPMFAFVQPNQYLEGSKPFSEWELANAVSPDRRFRRRAYSRIVGWAHDLSQAGLPIYDLTQVFSDTKETVYTDFCCHLNQLGNQLVAEEIVRVIKNKLK